MSVTSSFRRPGLDPGLGFLVVHAKTQRRKDAKRAARGASDVLIRTVPQVGIFTKTQIETARETFLIP